MFARTLRIQRLPTDRSGRHRRPAIRNVQPNGPTVQWQDRWTKNCSSGGRLEAGIRIVDYGKIGKASHRDCEWMAMRRFFRPIPLAVTALALLLLYTLAGFFLVPHVIKAHVIPAVSEQLGRPVSVKEVEFNPFALSLRMADFEIQEKDQTP